jgi:hypothetical protein
VEWAGADWQDITTNSRRAQNVETRHHEQSTISEV